MYSASADFITAIKKNVRKFHWSGEINFDTPMELDDDNFFSLRITRSISNNNKLSIGTVFTSQLIADIRLPGVSRYALYGKEISINVSIEGANDVIPMGIYTISEANQTIDHISINAYDYMAKFAEVNFSAALNNLVQSPHSWLYQICSTCGVTLGLSSAQVSACPNGTRKTGFADCVTDVKTWRDVLSYLATYLGSYTYIGRDGKLYLNKYNINLIDNISAAFRYSSGLSDYRTTYDGLYAIYKNEGIQEYVENENTGGLILDLGINPFLQISDAQNRKSALQEIIDAWHNIYYVPYKATMPLMPHYDPGDIIKFTGNQADEYDYGVISEITYDLNGNMSITCAGDNPKLATAQDRFTKSIAGLASEYSNGQEVGTKNFWLLHTDGSTPMTVGSTKTQVAEIVYEQKTDVQRMGFMFTCDGDLSASALIKVEITVDDEIEFTKEFSHRYLKGRRHIPCTWGNRIIGKGTHEAKVYMAVTDSALKWSELA